MTCSVTGYKRKKKMIMFIRSKTWCWLWNTESIPSVDMVRLFGTGWVSPLQAKSDQNYNARHHKLRLLLRKVKCAQYNTPRLLSVFGTVLYTSLISLDIFYIMSHKFRSFLPLIWLDFWPSFWNIFGDNPIHSPGSMKMCH